MPCREGGGNPSCRVGGCARDKRYKGCGECNNFSGCRLLGPLRAAHGRTINHNLEIIKIYGRIIGAIREVNAIPGRRVGN